MILDLVNSRLVFQHGEEVTWIVEGGGELIDDLLAEKIAKHYPTWYVDFTDQNWQKVLTGDLFNSLPDDFYFWLEEPDFDEVIGTTDEEKKQPANG